MSDEPQETSYYLRLLSMYMDLGTEIVLAVFVYHTPGKDAETFLKSKQGEIIQLKESHVLNEQECDLLFQRDRKTLKRRLDIKHFDISLSITLSRNLFTARELPPPVKGWNNPPRNSDKSVAADLLRLKTIRNVIVGHHPKARLPLWRFENEWDDVSKILLRLQQHIAPGKEVLLQTRIEAYRLQLLDPKVKNKYDAKLKQWHKEVTTMQYKVEELIKKLGGFTAYFNSKSDRFERYTKLLFKGGHFVLSAFLDKKLKDEDKDLRTMLLDNEETIRKDISDKKELDQLYPCSAQSPTKPTQTSSWSVSLLSNVILQLFNTSEDEGVIESVKEIGEAHRNYADATILALDSNAFEDYWSDLKSSMTIVSRKLDKDTAKRYHQIVVECRKEINETEFKTYVEELKTQGTQIKSFTETFEDVLQRAKDFLQDMITNGISFKNAQVLELKMITVGSDDQKKKIAEEILIGVWNEALDRTIQTTDFLEVKKEVSQILDEIRKSKSVKNLSVRAKCILLQMTCASPREMLDVIYYFESKQFHETLKNISTELGYVLDTAIDVYSVVPIECLWRIYNPTCKSVPDEERGLSLPITVSSPAGMRHLASVFRNDKIANCTNSIADALSKHLGDKIEVKTIADFKEFTHILETDISSSDSCSDCSSMENNIQDNPSPNQIDISPDENEQKPEGQAVKGSTHEKKGINTQDEYSKDEFKNTKRTLSETFTSPDMKKQKQSLVEENTGMEDNVHGHLKLSERKYEKGKETNTDLIEVDKDLKNIGKGPILVNKEKVPKQKLDIKHLYKTEASPSRDTAQAGSSLEHVIKTSKGLDQQEHYPNDEFRGTKRTLQDTLPMSDFKKQKLTLEEENMGIGSYSLEPSEEKYDFEAEQKQRQDIKHLYNPETSPSKDIAQAGSSQEYIIKTTIATDSEETFETFALLELYMSQVAVAEYLELAYHSLQDSPDIANEIISTSKVAKEAQEAVFTYETFTRGLRGLTHRIDLIIENQEFRRKKSSKLWRPGILSRDLHFAKQLSDETKESRKRYIALQTFVQENIQQVEHFKSSEQESGEDKHSFKMNIYKPSVIISKDESSSKYDIVRSQHIYTPDVTGIHQFKDIHEEELRKMRKGWIIGSVDIDAMKIRVEESILHKLRPGFAFTGGIDSWELNTIPSLFNLIRKNELDLQYHADRIKNHYMDKKVLSYIDHIVIQRRQEFDRLSTIRKQEKNKGLECLNEVTRHVENIDTQLTRIMKCWSEFADDVESLPTTAVMVHDELGYHTVRKEWKFVKQLFDKYKDENHHNVGQLYRFVKTAEEEKYRQHELIYEKERTQRRSEYKRSELKSPVSEKAEKTSYLKSVIRDTGKHEHIKKDEQQTSKYEHW